MVGMLLAVIAAALPARAGQGPDAAAAAYLPSACAGAAAPAGWNAISDHWLTAAAPPGWRVSDNLDRLAPRPSTTTVWRLMVDLDYSLRSSTAATLALIGTRAPGRPSTRAGEWLDAVFTDSHDKLGRAAPVGLAGLGLCETGVMEFPAPRACGPGGDCRRAAVYVDCGSRDGMEVSLSAMTPPYRRRAQPDRLAAEAVDQFKTFLCTVRYKGPSATK